MYIIKMVFYSVKGNDSKYSEKISNVEVESEKGLKMWRDFKRKEFAKKNNIDQDVIEVHFEFKKK